MVFFEGRVKKLEIGLTLLHDKGLCHLFTFTEPVLLHVAMIKLVVWFSTLFKIIGYMEPVENTLAPSYPMGCVDFKTFALNIVK